MKKTLILLILFILSIFVYSYDIKNYAPRSGQILKDDNSIVNEGALLEGILAGVGGSVATFVGEYNDTGSKTVNLTGTKVQFSNNGATAITFQPDSFATPITVLPGQWSPVLTFSQFTSIDVVDGTGLVEWQLWVLG